MNLVRHLSPDRSTDELDREKVRRKKPSPWTSATNIIIATNALVFVLMAVFLDTGWLTSSSLDPYMLYGANNGAATTNGEWWRLLTSMFMHFGMLHLLLNMFALCLAGHLLEGLQGRRLFALIYLGGGLAGGFASIYWHGNKIWSAGSSGAIFGVYGAIIGYMLREGRILPKRIFVKMAASCIALAAFSIFFGMSNPGIDNSAHVGGALMGLILGWLLALPVEVERRAGLLGRRLQMGLIALFGLVAAGVAFSPRFNDTDRGELIWVQANHRRLVDEHALLAHLTETWHTLGTSGSTESLTAWITTTLIPFYEDWGRSVYAMPLIPEQDLHVHRADVARIIQLRIECYHHLVAALQAHDKAGFDAALKLYNEVNAKIVNEIERFGKNESPSQSQ